ncbi:DUF4163 domain-containing protein [Thermomonas sp. S9]|uniref:DUF4163 domain-containing protein n=1 Tax=Thermomonas sp. S9 TaxID=2885203 RepID=UPI00216AD53A|nr:DUF4163 domain-containing protein [Thermomonas sp. S9]MCR6496680.1 DUF4163 domain-containing protein [Thermomonas sp. S9]
MRPCCLHLVRTALVASLALVGAVGCQRGREAEVPVSVPPAPAEPVAEAGPPALKDVTETTPAYIIGISYPQAAVRYPPLARALQDYAAAVQDQLMQAVGELKGRKPAVPYDLSLQFSMVAETPRVVAVAATGSSYLGGAHGVPLEQRFVWLAATAADARGRAADPGSGQLGAGVRLCARTAEGAGAARSR